MVMIREIGWEFIEKGWPPWLAKKIVQLKLFITSRIT